MDVGSGIGDKLQFEILSNLNVLVMKTVSCFEVYKD